jgi:hypothetical protein
MIQYSLEALDTEKILTGELDPDKVVYIKYQDVPKNTAGSLVFDKNTDLTFVRKFINLQVAKTTRGKFKTVIDCDFKEFTRPVMDPNAFLKARLAALEAEVERLTPDAERAKKEALAIKANTVAVQAPINNVQSLTATTAEGNTMTASEYAANIANSTIATQAPGGIFEVVGEGTTTTNATVTTMPKSNVKVQIDANVLGMFQGIITNNGKVVKALHYEEPRVAVISSLLSNEIVLQSGDYLGLNLIPDNPLLQYSTLQLIGSQQGVIAERTGLGLLSFNNLLKPGQDYTIKFFSRPLQLNEFDDARDELQQIINKFTTNRPPLVDILKDVGKFILQNGGSLKEFIKNIAEGNYSKTNNPLVILNNSIAQNLLEYVYKYGVY